MALYSVMPTDMLQHLVGKKSAKDVWGAIKVVCAGVDDTSVHVGQQETVLNDEMTLVEPEVTPVGSSSVATPSMATKVSKEVGVNMSNSEETSCSEAQPESTRATDIAGHDIQDREDVALHDEDNSTAGWPPATVGRRGACILLGIPGGGASRVEPGPREGLGAGGPETPERGGPKESDLPRGASCGDPENRSEDGPGAGDPETPEGDGLKEEGLPEGSPSGGPGASIPEVGAEKTKRPNSVRAVAPKEIDGPRKVGPVKPGLACPENRQEANWPDERITGVGSIRSEERSILFQLTPLRGSLEDAWRFSTTNPCMIFKCVALKSSSLASGSWKDKETRARSDVEEYVVQPPTALELRRLRPTRARMRRVLDYYPKKEFRMINNSVTMNHKKDPLFIKEPTKTEDANKKDRRKVMEKPTKVKSVTWRMAPGAAKQCQG
jgi:hypothetical protein